MHDLIHDITFCIAAAWLLGLVAQFLRQPVLLAYLAGGFLLGPAGLRFIESNESIHAISELGLIFLLFMIGLEIDLKKIASAGRSITVTALVQIFGGVLLGLGFFHMIGFGLGAGEWDALYLAVAASLSSTVIIVKVLYDKQELDTHTGRVTLGVLVLQDLAVILFLAVQPNLENLEASVLLLSAVRVVVLVAVTLAVSRYVLPAVFRRVARLPELVQVGALAWCFSIGELGEQLDLSREMGALIAGVALSTFPYALDVTAKVTSLRDFFITLFFVGIGMQIPMPTKDLMVGALIFSTFVVVTRFVLTFLPLYFLSQGLRGSLIPPINLAQVSEFSLVVLALGLEAGHLASPDMTSGMVALSFTLLAAVSTIGMAQSDGLVRGVVPLLQKIGLRDLDEHGDDVHELGGEGHGHAHSRILFLGFFRTASSLLENMQCHAPDLIRDVGVVDFSPDAREGLLERRVRVIYGDIGQRDTLLHAGADKAEVLVCTIPDSILKGTTNEKLVRMLRGLNEKATIIATAEKFEQADELLKAGADYVSMPRLHEAGDLLEAVRAATKGLLKAKRRTLRVTLANRREVLG
jgi:Kef-type K+ transport system membrane component KefB